MNALQRMSENFQELPRSDQDAAAVLDAIRGSKAPWEGKEKLPLYAGLGVEARALAALGAVELGPRFWAEERREEAAEPGAHGVHVMDARYCEGAWTLPDRLHVTLQYFGPRARKADICEAEAFVGTWHQVRATALVFAAGGGLLCAACELPGEGGQAVLGLEGATESMRPHVTLHFKAPWRAVDSTAFILAWESAKAAQANGQQPSCNGVAAEAKAPEEEEAPSGAPVEASSPQTEATLVDSTQATQ